MFLNNAKIDRILIFLVLQQLEWRMLSLQIVDIDAKEGKDVDKNWAKWSKEKCLEFTTGNKHEN